MGWFKNKKTLPEDDGSTYYGHTKDGNSYGTAYSISLMVIITRATSRMVYLTAMGQCIFLMARSILASLKTVYLLDNVKLNNDNDICVSHN